MRNKRFFSWGMAAFVAMVMSCATHYQVTDVQRTRLLIDQNYEQATTEEVKAYMQPFTAEVDKLMKPVLGTAAKDLVTGRPEAPLSNLLPDIFVWAGKLYGEKPDFSVYNTNGIRASIAKGDITIGDVFEVAPFDNKITFLTLSGEKVKELMEQIAYRKGEGVSHEVRMTITPEGKLLSATIGGKEIDPNASYRIVTIDYVAHGNDRMTAFKSGTDVRELPGEDDLARSVIMKYVKEQTANGKVVDCNVEGRITIVEKP
jgi:2',3'-cyclic-nucleotide 2'-phosphodiesterase (5'-nucleotidase family)